MHRILVVDDDEGMRKALCRHVTKLIRGRDEIQMSQARRAEEARMLIEAHPDDAWILMLDHNMPAMTGDLVKNGLSLAAYLHETPSIHAAVIMIGSTVTESEAATVGAMRLPKPIEPRELMDLIRPLLPPPASAS